MAKERTKEKEREREKRDKKGCLVAMEDELD